jgi:hypothetical protein
VGMDRRLHRPVRRFLSGDGGAHQNLHGDLIVTFNKEIMSEAYPVSVLFARRDSIYKCLPNCDVYDADRNALTFQGEGTVIAHPPCRGWGRMRKFSHASEEEKNLGRWAVNTVRTNGGVLEHPAHSTLFLDCRLPPPGAFPDAFGGWTLRIEQFHFGHRAEKATWLYIVGCAPSDIPVIPRRHGRPTHCVRPTKSPPRLPTITKAEREHTPRPLAEWLIAVALICDSLKHSLRYTTLTET